MTWKPGDHRDLGDDPAIRIGYVATVAGNQKAERLDVDVFALVVTVVLTDGRAVTTCDPELPKSVVAEILRQTCESIRESDVRHD